MTLGLRTQQRARNVPLARRQTVAHNLPQVTTERPARAGRIVVGLFLFLGAAFNSSALPPVDRASAVGRLLGILTLLGVAGWLISSGLPKRLGLSRDFRSNRRRIWFRLVALGFLVMVVTAILAAYFSLFTIAVLITWAYWFGWTFAAWSIAGRRASEIAQRDSELIPAVPFSSGCQEVPALSQTGATRRLGGWQRLWVVLVVIWTVPILLLGYIGWPQQSEQVAKFAGFLVGSWLVPPFVVYALGLGVGWIRRGFAGET